MSTALVLKNAEIYTPEPAGKKDILSIQGTIVAIGTVDVDAIRKLEIEYEVIDLEGGIVIPGLLDPHEHIIGGSGEKGYATQTPEITMIELVQAGITTVVGCIGVDTYTRNMPSLLAKAKMFNEEGLTAYIYSGGYDVPPKTLTGNVRTDVILIPEVIGAGEIAISDLRSCEPDLCDLARVVSDAYIGGMLSKKAGVSHFHVGPGPTGLGPLKKLLQEHDVRPHSIYPTHVQRNEVTFASAIELTRQGLTVDMDTEDQDLVKWVTIILDQEADLSRFTISTDAAFNSPSTLFSQVRELVRQEVLPLEKALGLVTRNTAHILALDKKGKIARGADTDLVVLDRSNLDIQYVIAGGKVLMREGKVQFVPRALQCSNRKIELYGQEKGFSDR